MALVTVPFLLRLPLLQTRGFNPDELYHLHFSWSVAKGLVPYLDYFDIHTPGLHFFMSLFYAFYDVERVADDAIAFILMGRRWMWLFAGAILALTCLLGKMWRDTRTGLLAMLLLSYTGFFLVKSLEVRPGVPASAMLVGAVLLALSGVRRANHEQAGASWRLFSSGLALGVATMFTQKILFVGPGFALVSLWFVLDGRLAPSRRRRFQLAAIQTLGFLVPLALTLTYFASRGAAWPFIHSNFFLTTRYPGWAARDYLVELFRQDAAYVVLAVFGFLSQALASFRYDAAARGEPVVALSTLSMVATLPLHPAMTYQHFLLVLPLTSLYAGSALLGIIERICRRISWDGARDALLVAAALLLGIQPLGRFRASFDRGNWGTLQGIRYVVRNTSPFETTLDGFTGLGLFRPQAFFHHFHHAHAYALQTEQEHQDMTDALLNGEVLPKLIFSSHYLREGVTPEMNAFLDKHYVPTGIEPIRIRPFDNGQGWWSDIEPRYLGWDPEQDEKTAHVIFDDGWRVPSTEYGASVRRTRTRKSKLIVPIRRPQDFNAVFRAHADKEELPFTVELVVNGHGSGVAEAASRWQDYEFFVSVHHLRPGFNEFELRFSTDNDTEARRLELAVNYLQLVPAARED